MMKFDSLKINASSSFVVSVSNDLTKIVFSKRFSNQIAIYDVNTSTWLNTFVNKYQVIEAHWVKYGVIFLRATCSEYVLWDYNKEIEIARFVNAAIKNCRFSKKRDFMIAEEPWHEKINVYDTKTLDLVNSIKIPCTYLNAVWFQVQNWVQTLADDKLIFMNSFEVYVYNLQGKVLYHENDKDSEMLECTISNQFLIKKKITGDIVFTNMDDGKSFVHSDKRYRYQTFITMPSESILVIADSLELMRFCDLSNECKVLGRISDNLKSSIRVLKASSDDKKILYNEDLQFNAFSIMDIWSPVGRALQKYMLSILKSRNISLDTNKLLFNAIASSLSIGNRLYKNKIYQWLRCARKVIVESH